MPEPIAIIHVPPGSEELAAVRRLWREHSDTLGFFPEGAFAEHAARGWVIGAKSPGGGIVGYLLYRLARSRAVIVHLCCSPAYRGQGIARRLFHAFRERTRSAREAMLTCRSDFDASALWHRFGFVPVAERDAREPGKILVTWWLGYGHPDLFSAPAGIATAVVDANVFFDLAGGPTSRGTVESRALQADWLRATFTLAVTPELRTEIRRNTNAEERKRLYHVASSFCQVTASPEDVEVAHQAVRDLLGTGSTPSDESDRRQLAHALAGQADYFVTRDGELVRNATAIQDTLGIRVLRPEDLINELDVDERPSSYLPARLEGSGLTVRPVRSEDTAAIKTAFQYYDRQESNAGLPRILRELLAQPRASTTRLVLDGDDALLGLIAWDRPAETHHRIRLLRVRRHRLGATLARHLLWHTVTQAVRSGVETISFEDPCVDDTIAEALSAVGFARGDATEGATWTKVALTGTLSLAGAAARVAQIAERAHVPRGVLQPFLHALETRETLTATDILRLEQMLWPLKITVPDVACYVVPIKPHYATELFDSRMASETLFGARSSELLLRLENVYYRSPRPPLNTTARVLWYVSRGDNYSHAKHVCAASVLTNVVVGPAKRVFQQFRRFGIYDYVDVKKIAGSRGVGDVMAFTFSHTELFPFPIPLKRVQSVLGGRHTFPGPHPVAPEAWQALYQMGTQARA